MSKLAPPPLEAQETGITNGVKMTLNELKRVIDYEIEQGNGNDELVISVVENSIGGSPYVKVASVTGGFDWDSGKFFVTANVPIFRDHDDIDQNRQIRDIAMEYCYDQKHNKRISPLARNFLACLKEYPKWME